MIPIVPAFIPQSEAEAIETIQALRFSPEVHLDVVDGKLTPTISWPYEPVGQSMAIKDYSDQFSLEVDLMVVDPLSAAVDWVTTGADRLVFHVETISLENFKNFEAFTHVSVGISAHGDTPVSTLIEYAQFADYIQLMGIHEIGAQGQPFDDTVFEKITAVKAAYPEKSVTVDGSVNEHTIAKLAAAGADRFIVGSAITLQPDPAAAHKTLSLLIN
jgi:pentose-5-phosphate-3-epimerase